MKLKKKTVDQRKWKPLWRFDSESNSKVSYEVKRNPENGNLGCSCPGWMYSKTPVAERRCKHTRAVWVVEEALETKSQGALHRAVAGLEAMNGIELGLESDPYDVPKEDRR